MAESDNMSYEWITTISKIDLQNYSILIIGSGNMASQYAETLSALNIKNVTVISNNEQKTRDFCKKYNFKPLGGGYKKNLQLLPKMNLVIIATPIELLLDVVGYALECGQDKILVEKPGSLYSDELLLFSQKYVNAEVFVGYNRIFYPNLHLLKKLVNEDGGITSCKFDLTEWVHTINFNKNSSNDVYSRWGISNSSHVISMVLELIGEPDELIGYQQGSFNWHPSGSIFVGSGISIEKIPFTYHANWNSGGRWGIEVMTSKNVYRLSPLEELSKCKKGTVNWEQISFIKAFPNLKQGVAEEIVAILDKDSDFQKLISVNKTLKIISTTEKIFGYENIKN